MPSSRRALTLVLVATSALALMPGPRAHAATELLTEDFMDATVDAPSDWVSGGSGGSVACLTAGTDTGQSGIPACSGTAIDTAGSGALRLTPAANNRVGFALYNRPLSTAGGLDITFNQAQYAGNGADGIAFFLVDGATNLTEPGYLGGSLGYSAALGIGDGVDNGLLGIGFDAHGNFSNSPFEGSGCSGSPGAAANRIVLRGPGNGQVGYCFLGTSTAQTVRNAGATRVAHTVRIVIDDVSVDDRQVKVYYDGSGSPVVQADLPQELIDATTFKFGFTGGTGGLNDIHEVWGLSVDTVVPITVRSGDGYRLAGRDGGVFAFGGAEFLGSRADMQNSGSIVGIANTDGDGYWLATSDGTVYPHGDAASLSSRRAITTNAPIVGIAPTPTGNGYWLAAADGGVFAYGDAGFFGSSGGTALNEPIVAIAATPSGAGYWLVASDGGVFAYGDATFLGSAGALPLNEPVVGMTTTARGDGYWLIASDGGVFSYGSAEFQGSMGGQTINAPMIGILPSPTDEGYWMAARDGGVFAFGDAEFFGSAGSLALKGPIVAISGA